jgi:hypothetical protein
VVERKALGRHTHVIKDKNNSKFIQNSFKTIITQFPFSSPKSALQLSLVDIIVYSRLPSLHILQPNDLGFALFFQ